MLAVGLIGSTININIIDPEGNGVASARVTFSPISTPNPDGTSVVVTRPVTVTTDSSGDASIVLKAGDYRVNITGRDPFLVSVPNDTDTYDLTDLITSSLTFTYATPSALGQATSFNVIGAAGANVLGGAINLYSYNFGTSTNAIIAATPAENTIADLVTRAPNVAGGNLVLVKGYNAIHDGGGGMFYATNTVTSTNIITRIASSTAGWSWERVLNDERTYSVRMAGATGDGETPDGTAVQAAADAAKAADGTLHFPPGTYVTTTTTTVHSSVSADPAAVISYTGDGVALQLGDGVSILTNKRFVLPKVLQAGYSLGWRVGGTDVGVKCVNLYQCQLWPTKIENFNFGLLLYGDDLASDGCSYNTVYVGHLLNNKVNLKLDAEDTNGFVNENIFIGGRFSHSSSETTPTTGARHILIDAITGHPANNIRFYGCSLEASVKPVDVVEYPVECYGQDCYWSYCRWEHGTGATVAFNGANAINNVIDQGYQAQNLIITNLNSASKQRLISRKNLTWQASAGENGVLVLANTSSNTNAVMTVLRASDDPFSVDPKTVYQAAISAGLSNYKSTADTGVRFQIAHTTGVLAWGSGSAAIDTYLQRSASGILYSPGELRADKISVGSTPSANQYLLVDVTTNAVTEINVKNAAISGNTSAAARVGMTARGTTGYIGTYPDDYAAGLTTRVQNRTAVTVDSSSLGITMGATTSGQTIDFYASSTTLLLQMTNGVVVVAGKLAMGSITGPTWSVGSGTPEAALTAPIGSIFTRTDGGASTTLYVKESGTGNTGWVAK